MIEIIKLEGIEEIIWRVDSKISEVRFVSSSGKDNLKFEYDAMGNRVAKYVMDGQTSFAKHVTYYVRDASGSVMAVYEHDLETPESYHLSERHIYGSSRVGMITEKVEFEYVYGNLPTEELVPTLAIEETGNFELEYSVGKKQYELSNHLGNVLAVISDWKLPVISGASVVSYTTVVVSSQDYSPFGVTLEGRSWSAGYRYGFNGKEKDNETLSGAYDFGARILDVRLGRWLSIDAYERLFPNWSPYNFSLCNPIFIIDKDGNIPWPLFAEWKNRNNKTVFRKLGSKFRTTERPTHNGVDLNMGSGSDDLGAPVVCTHHGKVIAVKSYKDGDGGGNRIYVQSSDGSIQTRYLHLESFASGIEVGSEVKEGQVIGYLGGSGKGFPDGKPKGKVDVHLHYEILQKQNGKFVYINPIGKNGELIDPQKELLGLTSDTYSATPPTNSATPAVDINFEPSSIDLEIAARKDAIETFKQWIKEANSEGEIKIIQKSIDVLTKEINNLEKKKEEKK